MGGLIRDAPSYSHHVGDVGEAEVVDYERFPRPSATCFMER